MEKLSAVKIYTQVKNAPLINAKGEFLPNVNIIFDDWYARYADTDVEGEMVIGEDGFITFMRETTASAQMDNSKLKSTKIVFTNNETEYVTKAQFKRFYLSKCVERPDVVRLNLRAH